MTRFFNTAGDFVSDFFGETTPAAKNKKKPNEGIIIDRKNDEKLKKKPEIVKKTAKTSAASKLKAKPDNDESLLDNFESTFEELAAHDDTADNGDQAVAEENNDENDEDGYQADNEEADEAEKDENIDNDEDNEDDEKDYEDDEVKKKQ